MTVMSHPFQGGLGGRDESPFPRRGGGPVMSHPKGACPKGCGAPPITAKGRGMTVPTLNQPYSNVASIKSVKATLR